MSIEEIAAHLNDMHQSLVLMAATMTDNHGGEAKYQFKTDAGGDIPQLDVLAQELMKHA